MSLTVSGCDQLLFKQDHRIVIDSPRPYSHVRQPLTLSWTARNFVPGADGTYAIFVDTDPISPGASIKDLTVAERRAVYVQDSTTLDLSRTLKPKAVADPLEKNHHDITVILIDRDGRRIGEEAGFTEFQVTPEP